MADPKEKQTPAQKWFESFSAQLREMGLENNPVGLGLICVRDDTVKPISEYAKKRDLSTDDIRAIMDNGIRIAKPAFIKPGDDNLRKSGESYFSWLSENSYTDFNQLPNDQIEYLYQMAKENKLFMQSTDPSQDGIGRDSYFFVNENGESVLSPDIFKLDREYKQNPQAEKIGPYSNDAFVKLFELGSSVGEYIFAETQLLEIAYQKKKNEKSLSDDEQKQFARDCGIETGKRNLCIIAAKHPSWANDPNIINRISENIITNEVNNKTDDKVKLDCFLFANNFDDFEKKLFKKTGCNDVEELFAKCKFKDENQKPIKAKNSFELMNELSKHMVSGKEFYFEDEPLLFSEAADIVDGINKHDYLKEVNFLISRLVKFEGNWTKNSPQYEKFAVTMKALPGKINGPYMSFEQLGELVDEAVSQGNDYIDAHKGKLSSRQIERVKIINRLKDLRNDIKEKNLSPGRDLDYKLAEKLFNAAAIKSNNHMAIKSENIRSMTINKIMGSAEFKKIKDSIPQKKECMLKPSGNKMLYKEFKQEIAAKEIRITENTIKREM